MKKRKPRSLSDTVLRVGSPKAPWSDLYHFLLRAPWWQVLLGIAGVYVSLNVFFALLYQVVGGRLDGSIKLRVPAGSENGQKLRVRGRGLPKGRTGERGDFFVPLRALSERHPLGA